MKSFSSILFLLIFIASGLSSSDTLIHSSMSFDEAVKGTKAPKDLLSAQRLIDVEYYNFDGRLCKGQLVMHKELVSDVEACNFLAEVWFVTVFLSHCLGCPVVCS